MEEREALIGRKEEGGETGMNIRDIKWDTLQEGGTPGFTFQRWIVELFSLVIYGVLSYYFQLPSPWKRPTRSSQETCSVMKLILHINPPLPSSPTCTDLGGRQVSLLSFQELPAYHPLKSSDSESCICSLKWLRLADVLMLLLPNDAKLQIMQQLL